MRWCTLSFAAFLTTQLAVAGEFLRPPDGNYNVACAAMVLAIGMEPTGLALTTRDYPDGTHVELWPAQKKNVPYGVVVIFRTKPGDPTRVVASPFTRYTRDLAELKREGIVPDRFLRVRDFRGQRVCVACSGNGVLVEELRRMDIAAQGVDIILDPAQRGQAHYRESQGHQLPLEDGSLERIVDYWGVPTYASFDFTGAYAAERAQLNALLEEYKRVLTSGGVIHLGMVNVSVIKAAAALIGLRVTAAPNRPDAHLPAPGSGKINRASWIELTKD